ncbi:MAG: heavy metal-associated domain-containing protein [Lachnospiraceae bacterium]
MRILSTPDLCCSNCGEKIHKALEVAGIEHEVNVEKKQVSVCDCDECMGKAIEILEDLGYDATLVKA